jgi:hypothetical protein
MFCSHETSRDVPLVVDEALHQNIKQSLVLISGNEREVIFIKSRTAIMVEKLFLTSATGYAPFERRSNWLKHHSHGIFSPAAFVSLRRTLHDTLRPSPAHAIDKVFVKRNSPVRNIINGREIEDLLVSLGFSVVEPERLSFAQQAAIFSNVDVVVGSTGAAMANLIFCKPTARIFIMIPTYRHTSYWYWQNIARAAGNEITYILGKIKRSASPGIHSDFYVKRSDLLDAIGGMT